MKFLTIFIVVSCVISSCKEAVNDDKESFNHLDLKNITVYEGRTIDEKIIKVKLLDSNKNNTNVFQVKALEDSLLVFKSLTDGYQKSVRYFKKRRGLLGKVNIPDVGYLGIHNLKSFISQGYNYQTDSGKKRERIKLILDMYFSYSDYCNISTEEKLKEFIGPNDIDNHKYILDYFKKTNVFIFLYGKTYPTKKVMIAVKVGLYTIQNPSPINLDGMFEWSFVELEIENSDYVLEKLYFDGWN